MAKRVKLNQFCEKVAAISTSYNGAIDYIDISAVDNKSKSITSTQSINSATAPSRAKQLVKNGDVLVSTVRPNLNAVAYVDLETSNLLVASTGYCVLRFTEDLDARYAFYFCQSPYFIDDMVAQATGASYPAVSASIVKSSMIPLYVKEQQQHIAAVLDKVSELIDLRKRQLAKLDELVKSRFVEMFGDTVLNPFGWKKELLGKVCDVRDGTHDSPPYYDEGYPLVTSKNVTSGIIDLTSCNLISETDFKKINERSRVDFGDILMPMIGTVGNPVIVDISEEFAIKNVALIKFYSDSLVSNIYIKSLLKSDYFDDAVISKIRGGTQKFISLGDIRKLEILVPPLELQNHFAEFVKQIDKQKLTTQQSLDKLETLKKSLMQEYFG